MATKTVQDMPKPDQIKAKETGTNMMEPKGSVAKGSLETQKMEQTFSPSATPKATMGAPAIGQDTAKKENPVKATGGGMSA